MATVYFLSSGTLRACPNHGVWVDNASSNYCNGSATIEARSYPHIHGDDYVEAELQQWDGANWVTVQSYTTGTVDEIGWFEGSCGTIPIEFVIPAAYGASGAYRVQATKYHAGGALIGVYTSQSYDIYAYTPLNLFDMTVFNAEAGNGISTPFEVTLFNLSGPCLPVNYNLDILAYDNYSAGIEGTFSVYEADNQGNPQGLITSFNINGSWDFTEPEPQFTQDAKAVFTDIISSNSGNYIFEIKGRSTDCGSTRFQTVTRWVKVNELATIASFELIYQDPNGNPSYSGPYPWDPLVFQPSLTTPVELGSFTGGLFATVSTEYYSGWEINVYKGVPPNEVLVGQVSGSDVLSTNFYQRLSHPFLYNHSGFSPSDNPASNLDENYRVELVLYTDNCSASSESSLFVFPTALNGYKVSPAGTTTVSHSVNPSSGELTVRVDTEDSNVEGHAMTLFIYNLNGKICHNQPVNEGMNRADLSFLPAGMYLIAVEDASGELQYREKAIVH